MALATVRADNLQRYKEFILSKELEWGEQNPESSNEQNPSEEYPYRDIHPSKVFLIKRNTGAKVVESFVDDKCIKSFGPRLMSEILKFISTYKLSTISGEDYHPAIATTAEGKISAAALYRQVFTDETMLGLYEFLMIDSRSVFLDKQYTSPGRSYCALVPLIMYAFKQHKGIPYEHWDKNQAIGITSPKLYQAMTYQNDTAFSKDEILQARAEGLKIKSGPKEGEMRNPVFTFKLYGATAFKGIPDLQQVMLSQIWCAHPDNRTKYMVLDPNDWDRIPPALIAPTVVSTSDYTFNSTAEPVMDLPW